MLITSVIGCNKNTGSTTPQRPRNSDTDSYGPAELETDFYRACWAVIVGINRYEDDKSFPELTFAAPDAVALSEILCDQFVGYQVQPKDKVPGPRIRVLTNEEATKENIVAAVESWLADRVAPQDCLLFYFSGHGTENGFLATHDCAADDVVSTGISVEYLKETLNDFERSPRLAACRHKAIILDSCYGGNLFEETSRTLGDKSTFSPSSHRNYARGFARFLGEPAFQGMSAAQSTQKAWEARDGSSHSIFTGVLIEVLKERADSRETQFHTFTFSSLGAQVRDRVVSKLGPSQTPKVGYLALGEGDILFRESIRRLTPSEVARREHRISELLKAQAAIKDGDVSRARTVLNEFARNGRDWAWRFLKNACSADVVPESLECRVAFPNSSGTILAVQDKDTSVRIVNALTMNLVAKVPRFGDTLRHVAFSPDGRCCVFLDDSGMVSAWDLESREEMFFTRSHLTAANVAAYSPDGRTIATGGEDGMVCLLDSSTGETSHRFRDDERTGNVVDVCFSDDGHTLAVALASEDFFKSSVLVFDMERRREIASLWEKGLDFRTVRFLPDSRHVIAGWQDLGKAGGILVWDTKKGTVTDRKTAHQSGVMSISIASDGRTILTAGGDCQLWDHPASGQCRNVLQIADRAKTAFFVRKETDALINGPHGAKLITAAPSREVAWLQRAGFDAAYLPSSDQVAVGEFDGTISLWDVQTLECAGIMKGHDEAVRCLDVCDATHEMVTVSDDELIKIWKTPSMTEKLRVDISRRVRSVYYPTCLRIIPTGELLAVPIDTIVLLIRTSDGEIHGALQGHTDVVRDVCFARNAPVAVTTGDDGTARIWDISNCSQGKTLRLPGKAGACSIDGTGETVVVGDEQGVVSWWDARAGQRLRKRQIHSSPIRAIAIVGSPRRTVSAGADGTIVVNDGEKDEESMRITSASPPVVRARLHPRARALLTIDAEGVRLWNLDERAK